MVGWIIAGTGATFALTPGATGGMRTFGVAAMGGGGYLAYVGGKERKKAMGMPRPSLSFGVGPKAIFGRLTW